MIKPIHALALVGCLVAYPGLASAQQQEPETPLKLYDVEIVVFKNLKVPRGQEYNLPTPLTRKPAASLDLFDPQSVESAQEQGFVPLASDELRLHEIVQRLTRSSRYGLLLHAGWRQPGLEQDSSLPVWIHGGDLFDSDYQSIDQVMIRPIGKTEEPPEPPLEMPATQAPTADLTPGMETDMVRQEDQSGEQLYELEGQITIVLSRYLHTQADLVLRKPGTSGSVSLANADPDREPLHGNLLLNYALKEKRRMRSNKLHYLDHPEFGMLVQITPYEAPPAEETMTAPAAPDVGTTPGAQADNAG